MDASSGRVLFARNARVERPIASTTKILTALVVARAGDLDRLVSIDDTPPVYDGIGLAPGDVFTRRQLMYMMLLKSANDAAYVLADDVGPGQAAFVEKMNRLAGQLGSTGVHMVNPHGLPDSRHRANALAVATWSRRLLTDPELAPMVRTRSIRLGRFGTVYNTNLLLWRDQTVVGVKTGYTDAAGYCLAAAGRRPDVTVLAVVLGDPTEGDRFDDADRLLRWAYRRYRKMQVVSRGRTYATVGLPEWEGRRVPLTAASEASATILRGVRVSREVVAPPVAATPVVAGRTLGFIRITQDGRLLATVPLVAAQSVPSPSFWDRLGMLWRRLTRRGAAPAPAPA